MFECFDQALFPKVPAQYALAEARYAYLWGRFDKGRSYVEPLMPVYFDLKILDTTFLYIRGLPFFQQAWAYLAAFSQLDGDFVRLNALTRKAEAECSDLDFEFLQVELAGFHNGDFAALKEKLRSSIQECQSNNFPCGFPKLQLGILLAQEARDVEQATRMLDSVTLGADDFPWLEDMRLLARCELSAKFGNQGVEMRLREEFMARQPLLFEPDNAISFNLLKYQENLRKEFVRKRLGSG
jgi:hypothetical protein